MFRNKNFLLVAILAIVTVVTLYTVYSNAGGATPQIQPNTTTSP